jgi:hypothetical protein
MQHLRQCNLPGLLVQRNTAAVRPRQAAYELDIAFPLLLEMVERASAWFWYVRKAFCRECQPSASNHRIKEFLRRFHARVVYSRLTLLGRSAQTCLFLGKVLKAESAIDTGETVVRFH